MSLTRFLRRWPVVRQLLDGGDGTGLEAASAATRALRARIQGEAVRTTRSVCPYCGVGCGQLVHVARDRILAIEGDPESPISGGCLCPKGAASHQLLTHAGRLDRVLYRAPRARAFTPLALEQAMDLVAERVWATRARTFVAADAAGRPLNHSTAIAHLGGATLDNEENYLIKKLFAAGLGMVCISNQARV
jgi:formate dehydrogenase major subunit